jgi:carbohydrate-binding DOMON domain-containing protein
VDAVNHCRAGVAALLLLILTSVSLAQGDAAGAGNPTVGDDWEEVKRESREALEAWTNVAREAARATWSAARERAADSWAATEEASEETLDSARDGSATAIDSTRQGAAEALEQAREESDELWRKAKPKVSGAVAGAVQQGGKAWDAAQEAGRVFWQKLSSDDTENE